MKDVVMQYFYEGNWYDEGTGVYGEADQKSTINGQPFVWRVKPVAWLYRNTSMGDVLSPTRLDHYWRPKYSDGDEYVKGVALVPQHAVVVTPETTLDNSEIAVVAQKVHKECMQLPGSTFYSAAEAGIMYALEKICRHVPAKPVVLPQRKIVPKLEDEPRGERTDMYTQAVMAAKAWNAALDEVARLNGDSVDHSSTVEALRELLVDQRALIERQAEILGTLLSPDEG